MKNWHPLTLLNVNYKILSKTLANRMKPVLQYIIRDAQTGFMENRNISSNIRKMFEVILYTKKYNNFALTMYIDFEKCFNRIEYEAIKRSLHYFGFGENFIRWVMLLYNYFELCTQNNGYISEWFSPSCRTKQGCGLSPFIFLCCSEVVAQKMNNNLQIKGIEMYEDLIALLSQFTDDTTLFLSYNLASLNAVIDTLEVVENNMGLKVNYNKTCLDRTGSLAGSQAKLYTRKKFVWSNKTVESLGIWVCNDVKEANRINFESLIPKIESIINTWSKRDLTIMGKVLIVDVLISSLFVYKMAVIGFMSDSLMNCFNLLIHKFLWKGKKAKIPMKLLQKHKEDGGQCLINLTAKYKSLLVQWVLRCVESTFFNIVLSNNLIPSLGQFIWQCNLQYTDVYGIIKTDSFWHDILVAWHKCNFYNPEPSNIKHQIIWCNSHIKIDKKVVMWDRVAQHGVNRVEDLLSNQNRMLSYEEFLDKYPCNISWLEYAQLK